MESLLRWSLAHADPQGPSTTAQPNRRIDPDIIDVLLGKPDAVQMKENLVIAVDESRSLDDRLTALDNFEMLIESIDNANNISPLNMWETLIDLSKSSEDEIKMNTFWILGTAVQNNSKAQQEYLSRDPLPDVLTVLSSPDSIASPKTRAKTVYVISNAVKHNAGAVRRLDSLNGWQVLKNSLKDSSVQVRRKTAFLLNTLLVQDVPTQSNTPTTEPNAASTNDTTSRITPSTSTAIHTSPLLIDMPLSDATTHGETHAAFKKHGIIRALLSALVDPVPHGVDGDEGVDGDPDFEEKGARCLITYLHSRDTDLGPEEKALLGRLILERDRKDALERWNVDENEYGVLEKAM